MREILVSRGFSFLFLREEMCPNRGGRVEISLSLFLSFCIIFEAATVNENATFLLHEHRFYLGSGASHKWNTTIKCIKKYMYMRGNE